MADRYLLESGSPDGYLLEDGSGVLLLEPPQIEIDASTPPFAAGSNDPWVTASFTPPIDSLLVVIAVGDWFGSTPTLTPTSSGLTFNSPAGGGKFGALNNGVIQIWTCEVGAAGGSARTVSVATTQSSDVGGVQVYVLTGHDPVNYVDGTGSNTGSPNGTNNWTPTVLTTTADRCRVFGGAVNWVGGTLASTSTDVFAEFNDADLSVMVARKAAITTPAGPVTLNFDQVPAGTPVWTYGAISIAPATGGGGTGHTVTPTDDAGLTDTAVIEAVKLVTQTDSTGLTDAAVINQSKEFTDSAGLTDTRMLTVSPVLTDSAGLTDTSLVELSKLVTQTDSAGLTDSAVLNQSKAVTDSAGLTDTATFTQSKVHTDDAGLTDTSLVESGKAIAQTDSAGLTDSQAFSQSRVLSDSTGLTDAASLTASKVLTDSAGLTDAASVGILRDLAATDNVGLTDATVLFRTAVLTDLVGLADATAFSQLRGFTDSAGLSDSATVTTVIPIPPFVPRPNGGTTSRPSSGTTPRPSGGTITRAASGLVPRPSSGSTPRP